MITRCDEHDRMGYLIDDHLDHCRAGGLSPRTMRARRETLSRLHDALPLGLAYAATEQLEAWLGQAGWSRWTRATYATHIRSFYRWATLNEILDGDPTLLMAHPKRPKCVPYPVTDAELAQALEAREPWRTAVLLAAYEGMRASEIANARREHFSEGVVLIPDSKGGDPASVPMHPYVWEALVGRPSGHLITNPWGKSMTGDLLSGHVSRYFDRVGLPEVRLHRFRHWYGTTIQALYGDARVTQECLRHASLASTQGYTLVTDRRRAAAVAALPVFGGTPAGLHPAGVARGD